MSVGGISIILVLGIVNLLLVLFLYLSEYQVISISRPVSRKILTVLLISAMLHGTLAILTHD